MSGLCRKIDCPAGRWTILLRILHIIPGAACRDDGQRMGVYNGLLSRLRNNASNAGLLQGCSFGSSVLPVPLLAHSVNLLDNRARYGFLS